MSRNLVSNLIQAIRSGAYHTALKNLERQGYRTVTVLPAQKLDEIVSKAIELTLKEYGLPLDPETVRGLSSDAKVAFVKLVRERDSLRETNEALERQRQDLASNEQAVRQEMEQAQRQLEAFKQKGVPKPPVEAEGFEERVRAEARAQVNAILKRMRSPAGSAVAGEMEALANEVAATAGRILANANANLTEAARREHDERVELLERRVRKLQSSLAETESMLQRLQEASERGRPSRYREVQGLSPSDEHFEQKRALLAEIFKLNKEVRQVIQEQEASETAGSEP